MDEFIAKFTSLLCYIPYIGEEKEKVQRFLSSLPSHMKERIDFDNPKKMDETIRKARICYQQMRQKGDGIKKYMGIKGQKVFTNNYRGNIPGGTKSVPSKLGGGSFRRYQ